MYICTVFPTVTVFPTSYLLPQNKSLPTTPPRIRNPTTRNKPEQALSSPHSIPHRLSDNHLSAVILT